MKIYEVLAWIVFGFCLAMLIVCAIDDVPQGVICGLIGMGGGLGAGIPLSMRSERAGG